LRKDSGQRRFGFEPQSGGARGRWSAINLSYMKKF